MYPSIHPSQVLRVIFKKYSTSMNNEWRKDKIDVERWRHLEKGTGKINVLLLYLTLIYVRFI